MSIKFLKRYTEQRLNKRIEALWPQNTYSDGTRIPTDFSLDPGATSTVVEVIESQGSADWIDNWAEIPEYGMALSERTYPVLDQAVAFTYTIKQVKSAELAAKNGYDGSKALLSDIPMQRCITTMLQRANLFAVYGKSGIPGLFNNPNIPDELETFNPYASGATASGIRRFLTEAFSDIRNANSGEDLSHLPDSLALPNSLFTIAHETLVDSTETNLVQWIYKNYPFVKYIDFTTLLDSETLERYGVQAAGTNQDWMLAYKRDPMHLERQSTRVIPFDAERDGMKWKMIMMMSCAATQVYQPTWMKRTRFPSNP